MAVGSNEQPTSASGPHRERSSAIGEQGGFAAGRPALLREINKRAVVDALRRHGPMTRTGIAAVLDISKPTIADVFAELDNDGLVRQIGHAQGRRGPRAALYDLHYEAAWIVGLDVGRRWVRAALADLSGRIVARSDEPADASSDSALIRQAGRLARQLTDDRQIPWEHVAHTTIGSPGVVDRTSDAVLLAPNLPDGDHAGMLASLRDVLGERVEVDNDVNLAALAELWVGHGRGCTDFVYLWVGTGVGAGLVLDGALHRGANGRAGEVAYLPLSGAGGDAAEASRRGRFETAVAADAVLRLAERAGLQVDSPEAVFALADQGDPRALEVVDEEARTLAHGLAAIVAVIDPELIVVGGGVGHNGQILIDPMQAALTALTPFSPPIITSALGTDAVTRGAVGCAMGAAWDHVLASGAGG